MLSKEKRLNLKKDFKWVASGEKRETAVLKLFFRFGQNDNPRVGIALSKSVFKKAVDRNRARRVTSAGFEDLYSQLLAKLNIIAIPKLKALTLSVEEMAVELKGILKKDKLLTDD